MVLCPYGSVPKSGAAPYVWLTWLDAQAWLGAAFSKLSPFSYLVAPVLKEINAFCATEPPQPTTITDADIVAAATDPIAFEKLIQYIKDSIYWSVWSSQCVCNPDPLAPPTCATGWLSTFTPTVVGPGGSNFEIGTRFTNLQIGAQMSGFRVWTPQAYNYSVGLTLWDASGTSLASMTTSSGIPVGYHEYLITPVTLTAGADYIVSMCVSTGYQWNEDSLAPTNDAIATWVGHTFAGCGTFPNIASGGWEGIQPILCVAGAGPTTPVGPTAPAPTTPDFPLEPSCTTQDICNLTQQTLQAVTLLRGMVDLIQRRTVPFAWIPGTAVTGLTGTGHLTIADSLGCIVTLTTSPGGWGSTAETPKRLIPTAGSLQASDGTNFDDWRQIHYEHEVYIFGTPWATRLNYNIRQGFVATITPIQPEP